MFEQAFKKIDDGRRKEAVCTTELAHPRFVENLNSLGAQLEGKG